MMFWPIKEFQKWTVLFSKASYLSGVLGAKQLVVLNTQVTLSRCSANSSLTLSTSVTKLEEVIFRHRKTKHPLENNSRRNFSFGRLRPFWQRSGLLPISLIQRFYHYQLTAGSLRGLYTRLLIYTWPDNHPCREGWWSEQKYYISIITLYIMMKVNTDPQIKNSSQHLLNTV